MHQGYSLCHWKPPPKFEIEALFLLFNDLKGELKRLVSHIAELKIENSKLLSEVDNLKLKVSKIESTQPPSSPPELVSQILQKIFERDKCRLNVLVCGLSESLTTSTTQCTPLPAFLKSVRLGKPKTDNPSSSENYLQFRMVKTPLQRQLLRSSHQELDRRNKNSEKDLCIRFVNGISKVTSVQSKNNDYRQHHPPYQPPSQRVEN
ncbi:hypothetical protein AGLY_013700 [Aphis glycines]|uniref:Uncharacterized protein n=1 Tax=Aphis glycines TaxID=307491 RepID=A0A6G0T8C9_APHGL|nr:hypothetical protein AGLY_013700 [Aphis glycines]